MGNIKTLHPNWLRVALDPGNKREQRNSRKKNSVFLSQFKFKGIYAITVSK